MVKITYTGRKHTRRRLPRGGWLAWRSNSTIEVKSQRLLAELEKNRDFIVEKESTSKIGGGIKTHVKPPKPRGRPPKSKDTIQKKVDKALKLKKPKGLRKSKRAD